MSYASDDQSSVVAMVRNMIITTYSSRVPIGHPEAEAVVPESHEVAVRTLPTMSRVHIIGHS